MLSYRLRGERGGNMTREQYLNHVFEAFNSGKISEEAYDSCIINIDDFC
jgi:hypothetical protein